MFGLKQFLPGKYFINFLAPDFCDIEPDACGFFLQTLCGPTNDLNDSRIEVYVSETPADTSVRNMVRYLPLSLSLSLSFPSFLLPP